MVRVLIVEDEEIIRKGLAYSFDWLSMGCVVVAEAADGVEGLEKLETSGCHIVITDIRMPRMGGIEMLEAAAALGLSGFVSILLTSYADFDYAQRAIQLKVFDYLLKPVDDGKLQEVIRRAVTERLSVKELADHSVTAPTAPALPGWDIPRSKLERNSYVAYAVEQIHKNYAQKLSVEHIAQECGVSTSYLSRKLKEITSLTFVDILNQYRIQKAVELLSQGSLKVYEVSERTGFQEYKHFCFVFKKYLGVSPSEYLRSASAAQPVNAHSAPSQL